MLRIAPILAVAAPLRSKVPAPGDVGPQRSCTGASGRDGCKSGEPELSSEFLQLTELICTLRSKDGERVHLRAPSRSYSCCWQGGRPRDVLAALSRPRRGVWALTAPSYLAKRVAAGPGTGGCSSRRITCKRGIFPALPHGCLPCCSADGHPGVWATCAVPFCKQSRWLI